MKITCLIVTYNRLELLKECIEAVKSQSHSVDEILIINNHSTDDTPIYLNSISDDKQIKVITLEENRGGSAGFSLGIKEAVIGGADWVWVMDDDTIPTRTALERMIPATSLVEKTGFVCSKVLWIDETPHVMNRIGIDIGKELFNKYSTEHIPAFLCKHATFVSILVNAEVVKKVGLPISEFFIWVDDVEYTGRISSSGYPCFYVDNSIVIHKTTTNYFPHPDTAPVDMAWRFYYQARNRIYLNRKKKNKISFFLSVLNMYRVYLRRINKRKDNKKIYRKYIRKGCWDGLSFNPEIEYLTI